jgi:23S rRNA (adenine2030-N6)-methyltransferase
MNYRHAFHAGNFADVHKHCILVRVLLHLRLKPAAFRVIDTHAGSGRYDLRGPEATRGGEWRQGIERVWRARDSGAAHALIGPYRDAVAALNPDGELRFYPGSPLIAQSLLRAQYRMIGCELEPGAAAALRVVMRGDRRCKALAVDGWTAASAVRAARARSYRSAF